MNRRYLIFESNTHPVVYFVQAPSVMEAIKTYIRGLSNRISINNEGVVQDGDDRYPHPLAYVEAALKIYGEWQIREMPDQVWKDQFAEAFCGEGEYGVVSVIAECRERFAAEFPHTRAKAFVWYFKEGTLITFYRKRKYQIRVIRRYLWNWDGSKKTLEEWAEDYEAILDNLLLEAY